MGTGIIGSQQSNSDLSSLSSNSNINALLYGSRWGSGNGSTVELTYSFITSSSQFQSNYTSSQEYRNSQPVSAAQQAPIRTALAAWARVANITFTEVTETSTSAGDVRFGIFNGLDDQYGAWAYYPGSAASSGDVWYHRNTTTYNLSSGGYFIQLSIHELGHALGLKHSFSSSDFSSVTLPSSTDSDDWTVMSYTNSNYVYAITPQPYDILAIQYLYGANTTTTAGADSYSLSLADQTIWDYGGTDTLTGTSGLSYDLDLRAGRASSGTNGSSTARYYIMSDTTIENASGSSGDDTLTGNDSDNTLTGGAGSDILDGGDGTDTASFDGAYANYTVTTVGSTIRVTDLRTSGDIDTLSNIEWLSFSDQRVAGSATTTTTTASSSSAVYRFFNRTNGAHFFTASTAERDSLMANNTSLTYEGPMFSGISSTSTGATSVYRFYNTSNGTHFYTVDSNERDSIIANLSATYNYEGVAYYVSSSTSSGGAAEPSQTSTVATASPTGSASDSTVQTAACGCAACRALRAQSAAAAPGALGGYDASGQSPTLLSGTWEGSSDPWFRPQNGNEALATSLV